MKKCLATDETQRSRASLDRNQIWESLETIGLIGHRRTGRRQCVVEDPEILERQLPIRKDYAMGDKGGKKDKEKSNKQKASKQAQSAKGKQEKSRPK